MAALKKIVAELYPLHRTLVSDGTDKALELIGKYMPNYQVETYEPGSPAWTWDLPERYIVHEAYLEIGGDRFANFKDNPLHLVSYSQPIDTEMSWDELVPHLHYSEARPGAIPWVHKYYDREWGFCITKDMFDILPGNETYHVVINAEYVSEPGFKVGYSEVKGSGPWGELLVLAHVCHPNQANDDAAGIAVIIEVANRLEKNPLPYQSIGVRFLFGPETIGSLAYLANNEGLINKARGGVFVEMAGNDNSIILQHSRKPGMLDRIIQYALSGTGYRVGDFGEVIANDERVLESLGIPCVSISRYPYPQYHTSDDDMSIIHESKLQEMADVLERFIRVYCSNYVPEPTYRGLVHLSKYGLWVDWKDDWNTNRMIEKIMLSFDGETSIFEIAEEIDEDYWKVRRWVELFREKGLI